MKSIPLTPHEVKGLLSGSVTKLAREIKPQPEMISGAWHWLKPPYVAGCDTVSELALELPHRCPFQPGEVLNVIQIVPIQWGDGKYGVGDDGNVYDISGEEPIQRKTSLAHNGYEEISLRYQGKTKRVRVNRVVCEAFYGKPKPHESEVRHVDDDRRNNRPENLDWGTRKQNAMDAASAGSFSRNRKGTTISYEDALLIRESTELQSVLAERFKVCQPTISKIKSGKKWGELPERPPRNYPQWASRLNIKFGPTRAVMLGDLTEADIASLGFQFGEGSYELEWFTPNQRTAKRKELFQEHWNSTHKQKWDGSRWIWLYGCGGG